MKLRSGIFALALTCLVAGRGNAGTLTATNSTPGLFDNSSDTRNVTFNGLESGFGTGIITHVQISINFAKADGESFDPPFPSGTPFYNEINLVLTGPNGAAAILIGPGSFGSGFGPGFDGTIVFDDLAPTLVNTDPSTLSAGTFQPEGPLSALNGGTALGTFSLLVQDTTGADALRFRNYTLTVTTADSPTGVSTPEPATIASAAFGGLVAVAALIRRRRSR